MEGKKWTSRISTKMKEIGREFCNDELAYLALTSKIERPIVDKLAFCLHRDYADGHVAREWTKRNQYQRGDLAVISDEMPRLLLEAKAMYGFDMFSSDAKKKYPDKVRNDVKKLKKFRSNFDVERTAMILLTDTNCCPDEKFNGIVKYMTELKKPGKSFEEIRRAVKRNFEELPVHTSGSICAGHAFGVDVTVHYWLFGPFPAVE